MQLSLFVGPKVVKAAEIWAITHYSHRVMLLQRQAANCQLIDPTAACLCTERQCLLSRIAVFIYSRSERPLSAHPALRRISKIQLPEIIETIRRGPRVVRRVPGVSVPEVILDQTQITPTICQRKPAGMPQHVGMDAAEPGASTSRFNNVIDRLSCERLLPL